MTMDVQPLVALSFSRPLERQQEGVVRPRGGFRVKRCEHGYWCDSERWICHICPNPNKRSGTQRKFTTTLTERVICLLRKHEITSWNQLRRLAVSENVGAAIEKIRPIIKELQSSGKAVGFKLKETT